jgi:CRP-like cAMP-binding protein
MLSEPDRQLLRPVLEAVPLEVRRVLHKAGEPVPHVYFVESGLVSLIGANKGGHRIEIGMVGFEGMTGLDVVLGAERASNEALVQSPGSAFRIFSAALREAVVASRTLHETLLRFAQVAMIQSHQTAIAAGCGKIDERLARGLLMWHDRIGEDELSATHEFLALLLGVRRQGVTVALHELEGHGWIRSTRKMVRILDRAGLQGKAGGFYGVAEEVYRLTFGSALSPDAAFAPSERRGQA